MENGAVGDAPCSITAQPRGSPREWQVCLHRHRDLGSGWGRSDKRVPRGLRTDPASNPGLRGVSLARFHWADAKSAICALQVVTRIGRQREIFCDDAGRAQCRQQLGNNS